MALDVSPQNLFYEVREAEDKREDFLGNDFEEQIRRFTGPGYRRKFKSQEIDWENHAYQWISLFLPSMVSGQPRVKARTPRIGYPQTVARAVQLGVNRNFELTDFRSFLEKCGVDFAFRYCVGLTFPFQAPGNFMERSEPIYRPGTRRISPHDYVHDYAALEESEARFRGHKLYRDKKDILDEAKKNRRLGWNIDVIASLAEDQRYKGTKQTRRDDYNVDRGEVELYEIHVPEIQLDKWTDEKGKTFEPKPENGYNGTLFTIGAGANLGSNAPSDYAREPRPFFGPPGGPYTFGGYLIVPDETTPLSPLSAVEAQVAVLNDMRKAVQAAIESYKKGVAINSQVAGDYAEKIREFHDTSVFVLDAVDKIQDHVKEISVSGMDQVHVAQYQLLRDALDRSAGMSDAIRGQADSGGTATAEDIAHQSSGKRHGFMVQKFLEFTRKCAEKEAWYLVHDPRSFIELGQESVGLMIDPATGEPTEQPIVMQGGGITDFWDSMDIQIEPISMRYTSEALEEMRSQKLDLMVATYGPLIPQMPYFDWDTFLTMKGEELGVPNLPKMFDLDQAAQLGQLMIGAQLMQGPNQTAPQPRLGIDIPNRLVNPGFSQKASGGTQNANTPQRILQASGGGGRSQIFKSLGTEGTN